MRAQAKIGLRNLADNINGCKTLVMAAGWVPPKGGKAPNRESGNPTLSSC